MKITASMLRGKSVKEVMTWVAERSKEGKMDQKQHDKVVRYLRELKAESVITDAQLGQKVLSDLNIS